MLPSHIEAATWPRDRRKRWQERAAMMVSINGGTPIAGWFMVNPKNMEYSGVASF